MLKPLNLLGRLALSIALVLAPFPFAPTVQAQGTISPSPYLTFVDSNGVPLNGGKIYTYAAGTTTPLATYSDSALTTPNANPTILDSAGRTTMFLSATSYKFVVKDSADNTIRTADNISAVPATNIELDITGTAGENLTANNAVYLADGTGGTTAGRWYKADADATSSSTTAKSLGFAVADISSAASGSIRQAGRVTGLSGLTAGTIYYVSTTAGAITSSAPGNAVQIGVADSTTSLILSQWLINSSITALQTLTAGAQGSQATIDARLDVAIQAGGTLVSPLTTQVHHTAGVGSGNGPAPVRFDSSGTPANNTSTTETDLFSITVPANTLDSDGDTIVWDIPLSVTSSAAAKVFRLYWNGVTILTGTTSAGTAGDGTGRLVVKRTGAATQRIFAQFLGMGTNVYDNATGAATLSGTVVMKITGQCADGSNNATAEMHTAVVY